MDMTPDSGGVDRNAKLYELRAGTGIDFGEKLNGEISAGYVREDIDDAILEDIGGLALDAVLNWSPRRETDVLLVLSTATEPSQEPGESGAVIYAADLAVTHRVRANLTANAILGVDFRESRGGPDETTFNAQIGTTYWFNRFTGLTARVRHEQTQGLDNLDEDRTTSVFVGLRLQR